VTVTLVDGTLFSRRRELRRGDPEEPFGWLQLLQRMRAFAPAMDDEAAAAVSGWCERFADPAGDDRRCLPDVGLFGPGT
jgi:hypothetical protein